MQLKRFFSSNAGGYHHLDRNFDRNNRKQKILNILNKRKRFKHVWFEYKY